MALRYKLWFKARITVTELVIIMTYPSSADELIFEQTTMLVRNGAVKNDFGSVSIINLFSSIDNPLPKTDKTNTSFVMRECDNADVIIVAYGRSTSFEEEKKAFLNALTEHYNDKLHTIIGYQLMIKYLFHYNNSLQNR